MRVASARVSALKHSSNRVDITSMNVRGDAGRSAERQMNFYLEEAFRPTPGIKIFRDVSFEDAGGRHQIDHVVLHKHSLFIIESKSVTTQVQVNERGEWSRLWNRTWQGMPSPVEQAKRQATALHRYLNDRSTTLAVSRKPDRFKTLNIATFVAISDNGRWSYVGKAPKVPWPVFKADLITSKIDAEIKRHERAAGFFGKPDGSFGTFPLKREPFDLIAAHLQELAGAARPIEVVTPQPEPVPVTSKATAEHRPFCCKKCGGNSGRPMPGPYGAYFVCSSCQENNGAQRKCRLCQSTMTTKIVKKSLVTACSSCGFTLTVSPSI
jgi:hypothetical protein